MPDIVARTVIERGLIVRAQAGLPSVARRWRQRWVMIVGERSLPDAITSHSSIK